MAKCSKSAIDAANFYRNKSTALDQLARGQQLVIVDLQQKLEQSKSQLASFRELSEQKLDAKEILVNELTAHGKSGQEAISKLSDINATHDKCAIRTNASLCRVRETEGIKQAKKAKNDKEQQRRLDVCRSNASAHGSTGQFSLVHSAYVSLLLICSFHLSLLP